MPDKIVVDRDLLQSAVRGSDPNYNVFEHPLIKKAGHFTGGFVVKWSWDNLNEFSNAELREIYLICKNSWNAD